MIKVGAEREIRWQPELREERQKNYDITQYDKWLSSNDPHFPEPIVFANEGREDVKRIAERIVEIVSK